LTKIQIFCHLFAVDVGQPFAEGQLSSQVKGPLADFLQVGVDLLEDGADEFGVRGTNGEHE